MDVRLNTPAENDAVRLAYKNAHQVNCQPVLLVMATGQAHCRDCGKRISKGTMCLMYKTPGFPKSNLISSKHRADVRYLHQHCPRQKQGEKKSTFAAPVKLANPHFVAQLRSAFMQNDLINDRPVVAIRAPTGKACCRACGFPIPQGQKCLEGKVQNAYATSEKKRWTSWYLHLFDCSRPGAVLHLDQVNRFVVVRDLNGNPEEVPLQDRVLVQFVDIAERRMFGFLED